MAVETQGARREAVDVGCVELTAPVGTEQVAVQAVEEDDDRILRASVGFELGHGAFLMQTPSGTYLVRRAEHRGWLPQVGQSRQVPNAEQTPPPEILLVKDPTNPEEAHTLVLDEVPV